MNEIFTTVEQSKRLFKAEILSMGRDWWVLKPFSLEEKTPAIMNDDTIACLSFHVEKICPAYRIDELLCRLQAMSKEIGISIFAYEASWAIYRKGYRDDKSDICSNKSLIECLVVVLTGKPEQKKDTETKQGVEV